MSQEKIATNKNAKNISNAAFLRWFKPLVQALKDLGGSATPAKVRECIIQNENLTTDDISITRGINNINMFEQDVAFARYYLVETGYLDKHSPRGMWTLTEAGNTVDMTDELASEIFKKVYSQSRKKREEDGNVALADNGAGTTHYWIYSPGTNALQWEDFYDSGIMAIGWGEIGDLNAFASKDAIKEKMQGTYDSTLTYKNSAHAAWQFANEISIGDIVFVKKGRHKLIGRGIVTSNYMYDDTKDEYCHIRQVNWSHKGEWEHPGQAVMKTLTDITSYTDYVEKLEAIFEAEDADDIEEIAKEYPSYTVKDFLSDVFLPYEDYNHLAELLKDKKNIILQGAPGVGKTFAAKRLAYSIMGEKDIDRVTTIQFHQSYSYEDFIMGYRPINTGFELRRGVFYDFCKKAEVDSDNSYFFIIDEINRGNLSKIFGELFMLIEKDKRGATLQLLYNDEKFAVPSNVHIIGMMNTADRSLAMLDYALRRRFAFFELKPGFETEGFRKYQTSLKNDKFNKLIQCVENLNKAIAYDESLGEGFCIGHSYFCNFNVDTINDNTMLRIVEYELIPLLKEYWFDEPKKVEEWSGNLRATIK